MPPFFDILQIEAAIQRQALPALERFAANPNLRRPSLLPGASQQQQPPPESYDFEALAEPLNNEELVVAASFAQREMKAYSPGERFLAEAAVEHDRTTRFWRSESCNWPTREFLKGPEGIIRYHIIVRRNIRKRWQKLGVWNPEWGIPGRMNKQPNDDTSKWKWKWQHGSSAAEWHPRPDPNDHHPVTRAVRLRKGIRCGEHVPPRPAVHLGEDATSSQAESFIMSRPWFMYLVEAGERAAKLRDFDFSDPRRHQGPRAKPVREWWEERGDWREEWCGLGTRKPGLGWKWRHESPSPEPEDLTPLNILDDMEGMDFTPSEIDALEAIRPLTPPMYLTSTADAVFGDGSITLFGGPGRTVFNDVSEASHDEADAESEKTSTKGDGGSEAISCLGQFRSSRSRPRPGATSQKAVNCGSGAAGETKEGSSEEI
ncbi:hypothetical protein QQX98_012148 [Neonectria punicea]|uniref:Uncharacterized protein n=1 Tax=Neonectria punicea TaxID=979145 RepID=A0ABR1GJX0_9HYPO